MMISEGESHLNDEDECVEREKMMEIFVSFG